MLKTAVLAPMPIAMIATATSVNSRAFSSERIGVSHRRIRPRTARRRRAGCAKRPAENGVEIELRIAAGDDVGENAAGRGRMLKAVAAEAVDQEEPVDVPARRPMIGLPSGDIS